jgi:hypothetical protein
MRIARVFVNGLRDLLIHLVQAGMLDFDGFKRLQLGARLLGQAGH